MDRRETPARRANSVLLDPLERIRQEALAAWEQSGLQAPLGNQLSAHEATLGHEALVAPLVKLASEASLERCLGMVRGAALETQDRWENLA